jgi:hypothetical protein
MGKNIEIKTMTVSTLEARNSNKAMEVSMVGFGGVRV